MQMPESDRVRTSDAIWSPDVALQMMPRACALAGVSAASVELLRFGTNAVYRLVGTQWILRLRRPGAAPESVERQVSIARWLVDHGYPANRPATDVPVVRDGLDGAIASFWDWVDDDPRRRVEPHTLGRLLRRFHSLTDSYDVSEVPGWAPIDDITLRLEAARASASFLPTADIALLESWTERLAAIVVDLPWALRPGLIHGDAHTGNVLATRGGPVLIDFDLLSVGPREWDLIPTAVSSLRFHADRGAGDGFCTGYGFDILAWAGWPTLQKLRELYMTSWLLSVATTPERQAEVRHRMEYWRAPNDDALWHAI
jgi:Ser/Thr protein kinase RdoA (MazF antagonist)